MAYFLVLASSASGSLRRSADLRDAVVDAGGAAGAACGPHAEWGMLNFGSDAGLAVLGVRRAIWGGRGQTLRMLPPDDDDDAAPARSRWWWLDWWFAPR